MEKGRLEKEYLKYEPDIDSEGSGEKDLGHSLAERMIRKYGSIENIPKLVNKKDKGDNSLKKENELEKELIFIKRVNGMGINPDNLFTNRDAKEMLIRELKGDKNYLSSFSNYQMGMDFKRIYYSALKDLKK